MTRQLSSVLLVLFSFTTAVAAPDDSDARRFGPEGEQRILELTAWLEANPLGDKRARAREVPTWWIEHPELTLSWCAGMLAQGKNKKIRASVVAQGLFGAGAFIIRHPEHAHDDVAVHLAGVKSALTLYKTAVAQNKKTRDRTFEQLVERWDAGTLDTWVAQKVNECRESEK